MNDKINPIVRFLSQWRVIIPLGLVVFVWVVWPQQNVSKARKQTAWQTTAPTQAVSKSSISFTSLFGAKKKLSCKIDAGSAVIDDSKVAVTIKTSDENQFVIFDGDCLYRWNSKSSNGDRTCGLSTYLPLLSQFGSNSTIEKIFPQADQLLSACKRVEIIKKETFIPPKAVLFKNVELKF